MSLNNLNEYNNFKRNYLRLFKFIICATMRLNEFDESDGFNDLNDDSNDLNCY